MATHDPVRSAHRRRYGQYCGLATALDIIGERWTLLIIRELLAGGRRYTSLLTDLPGIGTNLLVDRLRRLTEFGLVRQGQPVAGSRGRAYELTEHGERLRQVVLDMTAWGLDYLDSLTRENARPRWGMLAVEAVVRPERMPEHDESYEFQIDGETFHLSVLSGHPRATAGPAAHPAVVVTSEAGTLVEIAARLLDPADAARFRRLDADGATDAVSRCMRLLAP